MMKSAVTWILHCVQNDKRQVFTRSTVKDSRDTGIRPHRMLSFVRIPTHTHTFNSTTTWISAVVPFGKPATDTAARACLPASP